MSKCIICYFVQDAGKIRNNLYTPVSKLQIMKNRECSPLKFLVSVSGSYKGLQNSIYFFLFDVQN